MKKTVRTILLITTILTTLLSCSFGPLGELQYKYSKDLWGEWVRVDRDEHWIINSDTIKVGYGEKDNVELTKIADGIIQVDEKTGSNRNDKKTYCLYALRTTNASISGKVRSMNSNSRAVDVGGFLGNVAVTIENNKDKNDKTQVETNSNGEFRADKLIPGEEYKVSVPHEKPITIIPTWDGEDIGTISFCDGINFKVSIERKSTDIAYYADGYSVYDCKIKITNIGDEDCLAAKYELSAEPGLHYEVVGNYKDESVLGTIEAGRTKTLELKISSDRFTEESIFRKLNITVTDTIKHKVWEDSVSFKFYQKPLDISFSSNDTISGVILTDNFTFQFTNRGSSSPKAYRLTIPWIASDYSLVFAGASADTEAKYSIGIECDAYTELKSFDDPGAFEPNDNEANAKPLEINKPIIAYLHKNDIDYYKFNVNGSTPAYRLGYKGPAGGTIIYDSENNNGSWRYIEVAPYPMHIVDGVPTISDKADPSFKMAWGAYPGKYFDHSWDIGTAPYNSYNSTREEVTRNDSIIRACLELKYTNNGATYSDWFVPTVSELKLLKPFGYDISDIWSSNSRYNLAYLGNGDEEDMAKEHYCYPIRYFSTESVASPRIHHEEGSSVIEITCSTPGATIYYAVDSPYLFYNRNEVYNHYQEYTGPIPMEDRKTMTINAFAVKDGMPDSLYNFEIIEK